MLNGFKILGYFATNAKCGRIGVVKFGVRSFQILKLLQFLIKFKIGNCWFIQDVIIVIMLAEFVAKGCDLLFYVNKTNIERKEFLFWVNPKKETTNTRIFLYNYSCIRGKKFTVLN